ncbi:LPXTG cell wall anchor domain-containing protein [Actinacidiphila guanduensis]|uniref:LPXTG-motif cell wall anchor domain-containing protein n=1 Tax=Actinacidiphila guanduensis TaxID=310781 RepID=A0A1G9Z856_9ACTN|nr:LPXTG cell wall anchor domain-containing protein [Actinacidiphila guanduensis]SDN17768.1 LPXTG-motif cell wall anchor domain-containing protein [Actinacidiphila guanduensis]
MRVLPAVGATAVAVAATALFAPLAAANNAPGDNGTIKIHDAKTGEELVRNEPHVCTFYLDAFYFDGSQAASYKIVGIPPTGSKNDITQGSITLDAQGHGRTADMTLPDGHYKLEWNFDGEHGAAKHKVFWTDCGDQSGTGGASGGTAGTTGGSGDNGGTSAGTSGGTGDNGGTTSAGSSSGGASTAPAQSGGASSSASAAAAASSGSGTSGGGSLASTGASVTGISIAAVLLLAGGVVIRFRRKGAQRHL